MRNENWTTRQQRRSEQQATIEAWQRDPLEFAASEQRARELRAENQRRAMAAGGVA